MPRHESARSRRTPFRVLSKEQEAAKKAAAKGLLLDELLPPRTDGKKTKIPVRTRPLKNVVSQEEVFRSIREDPEFSELRDTMPKKYRRRIGLK